VHDRQQELHRWEIGIIVLVRDRRGIMVIG